MAFGLDDAIGAGLSIINKFIPDKDAAAKAAAEYQLAILQGQNKQLSDQAATNTAEAANASPFVAGWRPFIGWVCGAALAYQYVVVPVSMWFSFAIGHPFPKPPTLDDTLWQLMFGMLGMGGLRTFEKVKGVTK